MAIRVVQPENRLGASMTRLAETYLAGTLQAKREKMRQDALTARADKRLAFDELQLGETRDARIAQDTFNTLVETNSADDAERDDLERKALRLQEQGNLTYDRGLAATALERENLYQDTLRGRETEEYDYRKGLRNLVLNPEGMDGQSIVAGLTPEEQKIAVTAPEPAQLASIDSALLKFTNRLEPELADTLSKGILMSPEELRQVRQGNDFLIDSPFKALGFTSNDAKSLRELGNALGLNMPSGDGSEATVYIKDHFDDVMNAYAQAITAAQLRKRAESNTLATQRKNLNLGPVPGNATVDNLLGGYPQQ